MIASTIVQNSFTTTYPCLRLSFGHNPPWPVVGLRLKNAERDIEYIILAFVQKTYIAQMEYWLNFPLSNFLNSRMPSSSSCSSSASVPDVSTYLYSISAGFRILRSCVERRSDCIPFFSVATAHRLSDNPDDEGRQRHSQWQRNLYNGR